MVADEPLIERLTPPPEPPLTVADAHVVDATHSAIVRVELEVGPIAGIATHDGEAVRRLGELDRRSLNQMCSRGVPFERGSPAARPGLSTWWSGLQDPVADQGVQLLQRLLRRRLVQSHPPLLWTHGGRHWLDFTGKQKEVSRG